MGAPLTEALHASLAARERQCEAMIAAGAPLGAVLERLLTGAEAAAGGGMQTSILLLEGDTLRHGAAPNLPDEYCAAIDGLKIGQGVGSCGTAAYLGHPVYVTDIATDALWKDFKDLAGAHGLAACWSTPIEGEGREILGTFAIYHCTPRSPTTDEVAAIGMISKSAARAITAHRGRV